MIYEVEEDSEKMFPRFPPTVILTEEELENQTIGKEVLKIDIVRKDGHIARFWIHVGVNKHTHPFVTVGTNTKPGSIKGSKNKTLIGSFWWKKPTKDNEND